MKVRLMYEVKVTRTFLIDGDSYQECFETFKQELGLLHPDGGWEQPSKFDRGRDTKGVFVNEKMTEHVSIREFSHHVHPDPEIYADNEECPKCECADTMQFQITMDGTGRLGPMAVCSNCGFKKLFCSTKAPENCVKCSYRVECLESNGGE